MARQKGLERYIQVLNEKNMQPTILYTVRLSFRIVREKVLQDQQKLNEYVTTKRALQEILRGLL